MKLVYLLMFEQKFSGNKVSSSLFGNQSAADESGSNPNIPSNVRK